MAPCVHRGRRVPMEGIVCTATWDGSNGLHEILAKRPSYMHEGPVLAFTLMRNLGRLILAQNMLVAASSLGLSRLPGRPWLALDLGMRDRPRPAASTCGLDACFVRGLPHGYGHNSP
eukprot:366039-Chlamydomonas_euryale.AAC.10